MKAKVALGCLVVAFVLSLCPAPTFLGAGETKSIARVLKPFVDSQSLAGAVTLVADRDKVLSTEAVGYADVAARRPMLVDMLFWIASMSKPITGTALMILVDEGKVKLDDPVETYLPEFKGLMVMEKGKDTKPRKPSRLMTVRDVLSHTSGLPFASPEEAPTIDLLPLADAVRSYTKAPLLSDPGTKYLYSNAGINTAGRIIEVVSGLPFERFLEERLFGPLGMKDTTFFPNEAQLMRLAKTYTPTKEKTSLVEMPIKHLKQPLSDPKRYASPGGGLFSTANDLGIFCRMILGGGTYQGKRYLSEAAVKEMSRRQTGKDLPTSYGLGWAVGNGSFGHGGAYATNMTVDTKRGLVSVFMVQHSGFANNGNQSQGTFRKAAEDLFAK